MRLPRPARTAFASAALVTAVFGSLSAAGLLAPAERFAADALLRMSLTHMAPAARPFVTDVTIVALDPQSLRAFPSWPWPRSLYAQAIERLDAAGARALAFDIDLSSPRDPADDATLADAIARSGKVALAAFRQQTSLPGGGELEVASVPIAALADRAAALGNVLMPVEPDGVMRFAPRWSEVGGREIPTLAGAALDLATGSPAARDTTRMRIDYRLGAGIPEIPMVEVIEGRFDPRLVAGRAVLIGATAAEFQDLWDTPLGPARPGVWIQAVAYRTLAAERAGAPVLRAAPGWLGCAVIFAACLLVSALAPLGPSQRLGALALLAGGTVAASAVLVATRGLAVDPVAPIAAMASLSLIHI